jgi:uncharacterized membrane protein
MSLTLQIVVVSVAVAAIIASWIFLVAWRKALDTVVDLRKTLDLVSEDAIESRRNIRIQMSQAFYHGCRWKADNPDHTATAADNPYESAVDRNRSAN